MVNQEVFGGLISALSRGESLQKAMLSLFNAGYTKKEIEEAALLLKSHTPTEIMQKKVKDQKQLTKQQPEKRESKEILDAKEKLLKNQEENSPEKKDAQKKKEPTKEKTKQIVSKYGNESPEEFKKIIDSAIKNLTDLKSDTKVIKSDSNFKPPIIIQRVSEYGNYGEEKTVRKSAIVLLFILLVILLGSLVALFIFRDKLIEIFNNLSF
jgi:hypothetical protein